MSTSDLLDKLTNSNLGNWFFFLINGSPILWTKSRNSSDIDNTLVNLSMLNIIYNIKCLFY